jgi:hypothetical protein
MLMDCASLYANVSYNSHMLVYLEYSGQVAGIKLLRCPNNVFMFFSLFICGESMFACYLFLFLYETCNVGVYTFLLILPHIIFETIRTGTNKKSKKQLHNISHEKAKAQGLQKNTNWSRQKRKVQGLGPNRSGTQKANDTYTKYLTKQKPKPIQKLKLE